MPFDRSSDGGGPSDATTIAIASGQRAGRLAASARIRWRAVANDRDPRD
jgi:hypothetical protein